MQQARGLRVRVPMKSVTFSIYLTFPVALGSGVYWASNRKEYQKQKKKFVGSRERPARTAYNLTAIREPTV
jgi:hypothetical protein